MISLHCCLRALLLSIFVPLLCMPEASAAMRISWQASFDETERRKLETWLNESLDGVHSLVGPLPFEIEVRVYRRDGSREPVPWANTRRGGRQGVDFYVDPAFDLDAFRADWTAPHEFSHLILPYLGRANAWFAEGFASYMQYQVMMANGTLSKRQAEERYLERLNRAQKNYPYYRQPLPEATRLLRQDRQYAVFYWGGAVYFLQVAEALEKQGSSLSEVLRDYLICCRRDRHQLPTLIESLDRLSDSDVFSTHLETFRTRPGFPDYRLLDSD